MGALGWQMQEPGLHDVAELSLSDVVKLDVALSSRVKFDS